VFKKSLLIIFFSGLFARLFLMPWAMQADLLSITYRAHLISEHKIWNLETGQPLGHYTYVANFYLIKGLNGVFHFLEQDINSFYPDQFVTIIKGNTSSVGDWLNFIEQKQINLFIFLLKIPHLLADIGVFILLAKFLQKSKKRLLTLVIWWLNPVNVYAFYIFARHDALTLFALSLMLIFLARKKILVSLIAWFAAFEIRFQPLLYLPIVLIHILKEYKEKIKAKFIWISLVSVILALIIYLLISGFDQLFEFVQKPFVLASSVGRSSTFSQLFIFAIVYALLNLLYLFIKKVRDPQESFLQLNLILYVSLAAYFLINDFSPHYFVWLSLFASVSALLSKQFVYAYLLSILGWGVMGLVNPGNFAINQNLFLPLSPVIFNTPQLAYLIPHQTLIFNFGRLIFSGGLLWSSYLAIKYLIKDMNFKETWKKSLKVGLFLLAFLPLVFAKPVQAAKVPILEENSQEKVLLEAGAVYQNSFIANSDNFGALDLKFDTSRSSEQKYLIFRLKADGAEDWYYQNRYDVADFYNNAFYPFGFPPISDTLGKKFIYEVELIDAGDYPLYIYDDSYIVSKEGSMGEIATIIQKDLKAKWQAQKPFFIFWLIALGINLVFFTTAIFWPKK